MNNSTGKPISNETFNQQSFEQILSKIEQLAQVTEYNNTAPTTEFEWLRSCGALEIVLPGRALDFSKRNTAKLLELLKDIGRANLSVGRIFEGHVNALYLIHLYASDQQRQECYRDVADNGALFGIWNTQDQHGITFIQEENGLKLKGYKTFCSGAAIVDKALITGNFQSQGREGWQMAIISMNEIKDEKIDRDSWKPLGMKTSGSYKVDFSGCHINKRDLLGQPDDYYRQPYFNGGAIRFAAVQLGGAEAICWGTIEYLKALDRVGDPFQKLRLSRLLSAVTTGRLWLEQAGKNYDNWVEDVAHHEALIAFANMTRVNIEEICLEVMDDSNRCVGARGLMEPYPFERIFRDLTFYLRQPAPDATRLQIADFFLNNPSALHA